MTARVALVVAEPGSTTAELDHALDAASFEVRHHDASELMIPADLIGAAELVLVSASLGLRQVALFGQGLASAGAGAAVVVFPQGDYAALETCAQSGCDYVTPPFLPSLLQLRVSSCQERSRLTSVVEEIAATVKLREYERDLSIAREIQCGFLPDAFPTRSGWEFAARFRPAREVAGDFYDGFELVNGRRLGFVVADVCDKGVGAALFMALIRTLLRHTAEHTGGWSLADDQPAYGLGLDGPGGNVTPMLSVGAGPLLHAVTGTNRYLARNHQKQAYFATLFFAVLDPVSGSLIYVNGGHNPPLLLRAGEPEPMLLPPTGPAVGIQEDSHYLIGTAHLDPGDALLIYTDGVIDARNLAGEGFSMDRLLDHARLPNGSAQGLLDDLDDKIHAHVQAAEQFDDITMVVLRRADTADA
jgi:sigma-B regulation protein RsbU (phosphoserine phosphatase)